MDRVPDRVQEREERWRQEAADELVAAYRVMLEPAPAVDCSPVERVAWSERRVAAHAAFDRARSKLEGLPKRSGS